MWGWVLLKVGPSGPEKLELIKAKNVIAKKEVSWNMISKEFWSKFYDWNETLNKLAMSLHTTEC